MWYKIMTKASQFICNNKNGNCRTIETYHSSEKLKHLSDEFVLTCCDCLKEMDVHTGYSTGPAAPLPRPGCPVSNMRHTVRLSVGTSTTWGTMKSPFCWLLHACGWYNTFQSQQDNADPVLHHTNNSWTTCSWGTQFLECFRRWKSTA